MNAGLAEEREIARIALDFDCAQQAFFQAAYSRHRRRPGIALLLCLLLGAFGAHAFYLGRNGSGILRLLFCWTLVPALLALVEAPRIMDAASDYNLDLARAIAAMLRGLRAKPDTRGVETVSAPIPAPDRVAPNAAISIPLAAALTAPAIAAATQFEEQPAPGPEPLFMRYEQTPAEGESSLRDPQFAYSVATPRRDAVRMGPTRDETDAPEPTTTPRTPRVTTPRHRLQRITVRKVALVNGAIVAEASATREALIHPDPQVFADRVKAATEEARVEALHKLAAIAPEDVLERARDEFGDALPTRMFRYS